MTFARLVVVVILAALPVFAQAPNDPFPAPIVATEGVIKVNFVEFASLPDLGGQQPSRPMLLVDEPGTGACSSTTCAVRFTPSVATASQ